MINLRQIFLNDELSDLYIKLKLSFYDALVSYLEKEILGNSNGQSLYKLLTDYSNKDLCARFSTLFYYVIKQNAFADHSDQHIEYDFLLLLLAFDALFEYIDDNSKYDVICPIESYFTLPSTGVNLLLSKNLCNISKEGNNIRLQTTDGEEKIYPITNKYKILPTLSMLDIKYDNYIYNNIIKLNVVCNLIEPSACVDFFKKINHAVHRLIEIDKEMLYHLKRIEAIVPLAFVANDITKSFTLSGIPHLVFLSDSNSIIKLMENLIHECLHDELNIFMNYYDLISEKGINYYSSWRDDARPIRGLIHAIYVFTGIFNFYAKCLKEQTNILEEDKSFIIFRYSLIYYELGLAFYQLEHENSELTELGKGFIKSLTKIYENSCLDYIYTNCPESIIEHLNQWRGANKQHKVYIPGKKFFNRGEHARV